MRGMLLGLLTSLVLLTSALPVVRAATAAEAESEAEPLTPVITDAGPHHWAYDDDCYGGEVADLALDPVNPQVLYACGDGGLYRTTDGAQTWLPVELPPGQPSAVREVTVCGDTLYIETSWRNGALKSTDVGKSWTPITHEYSLSSLLVNPADPSTLYAVDRERGVFKSTDGGANWHTLDTVTHGRLAMCPDDPKTLWWRFPHEARLDSPDNGKTWELTNSTIADFSVTGVEHDPEDPDAWTLKFNWHGEEWTLDHKQRFTRADGADPIGLSVVRSGRSHHEGKPARLNITVAMMRGRHGGLPSNSVRITRDGGKTIRPLELPIDGSRLTALRIDPDDPDVLYAATSKDKTYYFSGDSGKTWDLLYSPADDPETEQTETIGLVRKLFHHGLHPEDGSRIVCHPSDSNILYATSKRAAVLKSENGGETWSVAGHGISMSRLRLIACHPTQPGTVYALTEDRFHRVRKWEGSHRRSSGSSPCGVLEHTDTAFALTPHPADGEFVVLCAKRSAWLTRDGSSVWQEIRHGATGLVFGCVFDPDDPDRFCLLTAGGIAGTVDGGRTWHEHEVSFPENCAGFWRVRQTSTAIIYSAEFRKPLLRSTDLGATWETTHLPTTDIRTSDGAVQVHPTEPSHLLVLASKDRLFRSADAGRTWQHLRLGPGLRCAAFDPKNPDVFYIASDAVYRTRDGGKTFEKFSNGLPVAHITQIVVSPADGTVYAATDGAGVYRLEIEDAGSK